MADSSLDVFFAKKDKSRKSKTKSKFATTDTIARKIEEGGRKIDYMKKDVKEKVSFPMTNHVPCAQASSEKEDDEWKHVEDERERDYTGLKVQALSISEKEKEEEQLKEQMCDQNGDMCKTLEGISGPWKIQQVPAIAEMEVEEIDNKSIEEVKDVSVNKVSKPGAYKPPALRNATTLTPSNSASSRRSLKSAPPIGSEVHFPSLSSAAKGKYSEADKSFQSVKHGVRTKNDTHHSLQLDLENKFSALHQGD